MRRLLLALALIAPPALADVQLGPRPGYLVDRMADSPLKDRLAACQGPFTPSTFSVAHRGAPLMFPEHTEESYRAAARMGAGVQECDVTFTKDLQLVCRHAQDDLHATTNILLTDLAAKCTRPFVPGQGAECRTSDLTLDEFLSLTAKMDASDKTARTVEAYVNATPAWRTELYAASGGRLMTHADSIRLFRDLGARFTPELKTPVVDMPFNGFTREDYARKLIAEYRAAGIPPEDVWPQSFDLDDILFWIREEPDFGRQAVWLDGRYRDRSFSPDSPDSWTPTMAELRAMGVNYLSPPLWVLVTLEDGRIVPSAYARAATAAGLGLFTWSLERAGPLSDGGGWYHRSIAPAVTGDGITYELVDVLAREVGVRGIFSDWPATVTFYANCMGLE